MLVLLRLFYEFFKTGLFAVGGGLATLPFLNTMSVNTGWFTTSQLADMIAVSESTPGAMGVNMATYVGFTTSGIPGAIVATLGLVTPSIIIILIIASFLQQFRDNKYVKAVFYALRPASTGLIAASGISVAILALKSPHIESAVNFWGMVNWKGVVLAIALVILTRYVKFTKKLHPIIFILASALVGIVFRFAGV